MHDSAAAIVQPTLAQHGADEFLHRTAVAAEDVGAKGGADSRLRFAQARLRRPRDRRPQREVQLDLARRRENRRLDRRRLLAPRRVERLAASSTCDSQRPVTNRLVAVDAIGAGPSLRAPSQSTFSIGCSSRGGPGSSTMSCLAVFEILPRRRAVRVGEHVTAPSSTLRLSPVDVGHLQPAPREPRGDVLDDRRLLDLPPSGHRRDGIAREIVVSGTEPAGQHDEVDAVSACRHSSAIRSRSSPTTLFAAQLDANRRTGARRCTASWYRAGSMPSSSEPTAMISAVRSIRPRVGFIVETLEAALGLVPGS